MPCRVMKGHESKVMLYGFGSRALSISTSVTFATCKQKDFQLTNWWALKKQTRVTNTAIQLFNMLVFVQSLSTHIADIIMTIPKPSWKLTTEKAMYLTYWQYIFSIDWIPWIYFKALTPKCTSRRQILNTTNLESIQIWLWEPMELKRRWRELKKHIFWKLLSTSCFSPISKETCFEAVTLSTLAHLHYVQRNPIWLNACNLQLLHLWAFHQSVVLKHVAFTCGEQMKNFVLDCQSFDTHFLVCTKNGKTMELVANCSSMNHQ